MIKNIVFFLSILISSTTFANEGQTNSYPTKPIRFLVGVAPGGGTDFVARLIAGKLSEKLHQPVIIDNRTGATGTIALEIAAKALPDGYTFVVFNIGHLMSALLARVKRVDAVKDFSPVGQIATGTLLLAINANIPAKNLTEFISYVRTRPGKLSYGSGGLGSTQQLAMELLKQETHLDILHVPYKGTGPISVDLASGQIQVAISNFLALYPHVKAGRLTALAVASNVRNKSSPEIPTISELGYPKVQTDLWQAILAPANTPNSIIKLISQNIAEIVHQPEVIAKLSSQGGGPAGTSPEEFSRYLKVESIKWLTLAKEVNVTAD
ncbi:MAG: tripartite tricarboxylate transporter substrate binding protein [Betaproteobacteria bacterium]